eukprot:6437796-Alexandrium_andersonii.AAC.1
MCIRDRQRFVRRSPRRLSAAGGCGGRSAACRLAGSRRGLGRAAASKGRGSSCLLYTSPSPRD